MKFTRLLQASVLAGAMTTGAAQADMIYGIYLGAQGWQTETSGYFGNDGEDINSVQFNYEDETQTSFYVAIEHPVPLLPNIKVRQNDIQVEGDTVGQIEFGGEVFVGTADTDGDITNTDFILYYEILDNDLVSFDIGINGKSIDGEFTMTDTTDGFSGTSTETFSGVVPMAYAAAEIGLPFTGLSIFGDISYIGFDGHSLQDAQVGIQYAFIDNIAVDVSIQAGFRTFAFELDDLDDISSDITIDGAFAGLQVHF